MGEEVAEDRRRVVAQMAELCTPALLRKWIAARPDERHEDAGWFLLYLNGVLGRRVGWDDGFYGTYLVFGGFDLEMALWAQTFMWNVRGYRTGSEALDDLDVVLANTKGVC